MMRLVSLATLAAVLAPGAAPARPRETPIATPDGKPVDCLQLQQIRETRVRDDRTIDFYTYGRQVYRNTLPFQCPELGFEESFGYRLSTQQLCSVDTITVIRQGSTLPGVTCGLGRFQPVTIAGEKGAGSKRAAPAR